MKYKFVGSGPGIPGMAHEINDEDVARMNEAELDQLHEAILNRSYINMEILAEPVKVPGKPKKSVTSVDKEKNQ